MGMKFNGVSGKFDLVNAVDSFVVGPAVSTDNAVARFDSTTGKLIQNSGVIIDDSDNVTGIENLTGVSTLGCSVGTTVTEFSTDGTLAGDSDDVISTEKAVKTYVDAAIAGVTVTPPPREYPIDASAFHAVETNFAALEQVTGDNAIKFCRAFDDTTDEYGNYKFFLPSDLDTSGTVTFRALVWAKTAAADKNIALTFGHIALADGEDWDVTYTDVDSGDIPINATQDSVTVATWTETVANLGWAAGDFIQMRLSRDPSAGDDLTGDMYLDSFNLEVPRI
jgi:hypothetical protein